MDKNQRAYFKTKLTRLAEDQSIGNETGSALLLARHTIETLENTIETLMETVKKYATEMQNVAECVNMPIASGERVIERVKELAAKEAA